MNKRKIFIFTMLLVFAINSKCYIHITPANSDEIYTINDDNENTTYPTTKD